MVPYWVRTKFTWHHLYDLESDPEETLNLAGSGLETEMANGLQNALTALNAPASQFQRLGLRI